MLNPSSHCQEIQRREKHIVTKSWTLGNSTSQIAWVLQTNSKKKKKGIEEDLQNNGNSKGNHQKGWIKDYCPGM